MASQGWQRRWRVGWSIALLLCLAPASAVAQDPTPKKYALLIGIDKYLGADLQGVPELSYAVKDAKSLQEVLEKRGWETVPVVKGEATRQRIVRELYDLAVITEPHDKVLIYFAGHGVRDAMNGDHTYWLTYQASIATLVAEGIRLNHILEYVRDIRAREKIVLLDHCYSGDIKRVPEAVPAALPAAPPAAGEAAAPSEVTRLVPGRPELDTDPTSRALLPPDLENLEQQSEDRMVVLGAARGPAYEHPDWGHGMFTKAILDVLADPQADSMSPKDGKISLDEFWRQVSGKVQSMADEKGLQQKPFGTQIKADQLDWALFDAAEDAGGETSRLRDVLTELDLVAMLDFQVKMACHELLGTWEQREQGGLDQDPKHLRVVNELRAIRDSGTSSQADAKKQSLEALVRALGLVS